MKPRGNLQERIRNQWIGLRGQVKIFSVFLHKGTEEIRGFIVRLKT
ncbi:hypothetical protein LEP1GSC193_2698 [Leptospira alstonii serovar Pingchang str. 80-412]|uniref:Uncharacterized protein n=2 Tax=Leptospira alstonii TaxID=28452 RepID=M6CQI5_9LEPT|nr:hypothetical protein LEP1GSC194_0163 [Leptospira alstonii serovar Sichuan str. 79601]EQA79198.1 hypothetical protein LEP1GSC193_2698 [Leptospira alstonii serovar Pingchang str. 80-412]